MNDDYLFSAAVRHGANTLFPAKTLSETGLSRCVSVVAAAPILKVKVFDRNPPRQKTSCYNFVTKLLSVSDAPSAIYKN